MTPSRQRHPPVVESLEPRLQLSGASDLTHSTTMMPDGRIQVAATAVAGKAFFAGGANGVANSDAIDIYDVATAQWSTAKLSFAKFSVAAVSVAGKALFADGPVVDIYDGKSGKWSSIRALRDRGGGQVAAAGVGDLAIFVGGGVYPDTKASAHADIYNVRTRRWSTMKLPAPLDEASATTVGGLVVFVAGSTAEIYDSTSHRWSASTLPLEFTYAGATTIGTKAFFANADQPGVEPSNVVMVYDAISGQWSTATLSQARQSPVAATLGTKAIFAGGYALPFSGLDSAQVDVYDDRTDQWSIATALSQPRDALGAASVGRYAIFAGGNAQQGAIQPQSAVDIYTDTSPAASLSGILSTATGRRNRVTILNTGDADLPAGATGALYASPSRTLDAASVLIGQTTLTSPLPAGSSVQVSIPTSLKSLSPGQYHLVAAVDDHSGSAPTPIASQAEPFTIRAAASRNSPFSTAPLHAWPLGGDQR